MSHATVPRPPVTAFLTGDASGGVTIRDSRDNELLMGRVVIVAVSPQERAEIGMTLAMAAAIYQALRIYVGDRTGAATDEALAALSRVGVTDMAVMAGRTARLRVGEPDGEPVPSPLPVRPDPTNMLHEGIACDAWRSFLAEMRRNAGVLTPAEIHHARSVFFREFYCLTTDPNRL